MRNKRMKQFIAGALAVGMIMTVPMTTEATTVTKQTTISPLCEYSYSSEISKEGAIYVELDAAEDYITNVKVRNKNLIAKVTRRDGYYSKYGDNNESKSDKYTAVIGLYAKKELTTKVSFDIYGKDHKKKETKTVTVVAKANSDENAVKSITFAGKPISYDKLYTQKSGKLKIKMNKNYKLTKVEVGGYKKKMSNNGDKDNYNSEVEYKVVKNNANIKLSTIPYMYSYAYKYDKDSYLHRRKEIIAYTWVRVTYKNTKTKKIGVATYSIKKVAK